jgi:hypothetical protein
MEKYEKINFFTSLKSLKKGVGPLVRGMDPGIRLRIRTKMSRIHNTGTKYKLYNLHSFPVHWHVVYTAL